MVVDQGGAVGAVVMLALAVWVAVVGALRKLAQWLQMMVLR